MENKVESYSEEKAVCHTYNSLVSEMASRMVVDEQKIMPKDGDRFDYEDINSWVSAVDFLDGETPAIEAILSSRQGKERFVFDTRKVSTIKSEIEGASKEELLYSMALTEAKMKVIADIAEETYPAVAFQIGDYRKEMEKVREEVLETKGDSISMGEVMDKMRSRRTMMLATSIVIGSMVMNACVPIVGAEVVQKPIESTANPAITETFIPPIETAETSPTEVAVTEMPTSTYELDLESIVFPPIGYAKEAYEKGEYEDGLRDINQWVSIWNKMGFFDESIIAEGFKPVILDGSARIVCVSTNSDKYAKTLYCPPMAEDGGLKTFPSLDQLQDTDKPIVVNLSGTQGLTVKGKDKELTYQLADKYTGKAISFYDYKTKKFTEGIFIPSLEIKENESIKESVVCVADEFCMGGQMTVDQEIGKVFYKKYMEALMSNWANKDYFKQLIGDEPSYEKLQKYLDQNNGYAPAGLKLLTKTQGANVNMKFISEKPINLSFLKTIVIGPQQWRNNFAGIQDYMGNFDKKAIINPYETIYGEVVYFGWFLDKNNVIVLVNGSLSSAPEDWHYVLGGSDGKYIPERDNMIATGQALSFIVYSEKHVDQYDDKIVPFIEGPSLSSPKRSDIGRILGGNLFKKR